jgi:hypothetical protein
MACDGLDGWHWTACGGDGDGRLTKATEMDGDGRQSTAMDCN